MIDAVASANGSLTRAQRIPGNGKARFDVFPVVLVEWRSAFADLCEGERAWPVGRYEKNGQAILHFHGNAKEFVAQAVATNSLAFPWKRSEEHTSELQSRVDLVCRLLLEK